MLHEQWQGRNVRIGFGLGRQSLRSRLGRSRFDERTRELEGNVFMF